MRVLLAVLPLVAFDLHACEDQLPELPGGLGGAPAAPTAPGPHSGALVTAGGRPVELVARTDGTLEVHGLTAGPQALGTDWPVSAAVKIGEGPLLVVPLHYRPEATRYEGTVPGGPAQPGAFRVGYIADGKTHVADGTLAQVLPPGPPVAAAAPAPAEAPAVATVEADAGTAEVAATEEAPAPETATAEAPAAEEPAAATPVATVAPATAPAPAPATATPAPATSMRAAATPSSSSGERRSSGGFRSSRSRNRR